MANKIAIMGVGAVGGYAGAHMVQAGEDVTFIDPWPEHVEKMQRDGLKITHIRDVPVHREGARAARHRRAAARQGAADRHRLRLHEILRHRLGDHDDQPVSGARRLYRLAAELHERGDDRRRRRLGQDGRLDRQLDHRRSVRAGPCAPRRRQERQAPHGVPRRRGARPHHRPGEGGLPPGRPGRQRHGHREPVGRALVEAGDQRDGQRPVGLHRDDRQGHGQERRDPALLDPARQRGDPRRPGARLRPRGDPAISIRR